MATSEQPRERIIARYSDLARTALAGGTPTDCDPDAFTGCGPDAFTEGGFGAAGYAGIEAAEGALSTSLGCGNPVAVADLTEGDTVLDLGSGGGLDVLLSARRVGAAGRVYGLDASAEMLALARRNAEEAGAANVEWLSGHIEAIPLPDDHVDVVISNCVINLSAEKPRVFAEAFRVLRPGGRFGVSDVLAEDGSDPGARAAGELRVGCVNGTLSVTEYRTLLQDAGFIDVAITPTRDLGAGLLSALVHATKPA